MRAVLLIFLGLIGLGLALSAQAAPVSAGATASPCERVVRLSLPHVEITSAAPVASGGHGAVAYCRVKGHAHPTAASDIVFVVLMPEKAAWNGRFVQIGNGGLAGQVPESLMVPLVSQGYAVAGTDDGHQGDSADGTWAIGHPEKRIDFAYRALKETTAAAKPVITVYEGRSPKYSYFMGCSAGGREALMEAQRFPEDFDGIIAGAPPYNWTSLGSFGTWIYQAVAAGGWMSPEELQLVEAEVHRQCGADADGVVDDPEACHFDPDVLRCRGSEQPGCLTQAQTAVLHRIYGGMRDPRTGKIVVEGYTPGGEAESKGWVSWMTGPTRDGKGSLMYVLGQSIVGDVILGQPKLNLGKFDAPGSLRRLAAAYPEVKADSVDLRAFKRRGGKLLMFHGWIDQAIPTRNSIAYFNQVRSFMGKVDDFYRLFLVPGMLHCSGGPGCSSVDWLSAITSWVESGQAPDMVVATKFKGDNPANGVERTRPVCRYPLKPVWDGRGDKRDAQSFRCHLNPN